MLPTLDANFAKWLNRKFTIPRLQHRYVALQAIAWHCEGRRFPIVTSLPSQLFRYLNKTDDIL